MPNKNQNLINNLIDKTDIVAVISQFIKLQRKGANYVGLCPFHADHNPSLVVSNNKKIFKCFVCQESGNVINFVQKYQKIPRLEAIKYVAEVSGFDPKQFNDWFSNHKIDPSKLAIYDLNDQTNKWFQIFLKDKKQPIAYQYLKSRQLDDSMINKYEFGYGSNKQRRLYQMIREQFIDTKKLTQDQVISSGLIGVNNEGQFYDFLFDRLTFPIRNDQGYIVGFGSRTLTETGPKYLNTTSTETFEKGSILYNFFRIDQENVEKIILVEGYMDVIAYDRAGISDVAAIMGTALTDRQIDLLKKCPKLKTIILSFDNDQAGIQATKDNGIKLLKHNWNVTTIASYDKQYKDVDELMNHQPDELKRIVNERVDFLGFLIKQTLTPSLTIDEKQVAINDLMLIISEYGNELLLTQYLNLIAKHSGFLIDDIRLKLKKLSIKNKASKKKISYSDLKSLYKASFKTIDENLIDTNETEINQSLESVPEISLLDEFIESFKKAIFEGQAKLNGLYDYLILYASYDLDFAKYMVDNLKQMYFFDANDPRKDIWKMIVYLIQKEQIKAISPKIVRATMETFLKTSPKYQMLIDYYDHFFAQKATNLDDIIKSFLKNKSKWIDDIFKRIWCTIYDVLIAYSELAKFESYKNHNHAFDNKVISLNDQIKSLKIKRNKFLK